PRSISQATRSLDRLLRSPSRKLNLDEHYQRADALRIRVPQRAPRRFKIANEQTDRCAGKRKHAPRKTLTVDPRKRHLLEHGYSLEELEVLTGMTERAPQANDVEGPHLTHCV